MDAIEKRARELLAAEYERNGRPHMAEVSRRGAFDELPEMKAIVAALTPPEGDALAAAARAAIPFIAYAFDQGVDGAEEVGRAVEAALMGKATEVYVPERAALGAATRIRMLASAAPPMARSAYIKAAEMVEAAVIAARPEVP